MKKYTFVSLVMATLSMAACMKDEVPDFAPMSLLNQEMVTLNVSVSETNTKAVSTTGESKINSVQVFVFDASEGYIEAYSQGTTSSVTISCTTGEKEIVALVNAREINDIAYRDELFAKITDLSENLPSAFVMIGSIVESITADTFVSVNVSRMVARIGIAMIKKRFTLPLYQEGVTSIKRIFLENVAGDVPFQAAGDETFSYSPTVWYNKSKYNSELPDLISEDINAVIGRDYTIPHYFYCYPNPNTEANATRLVVEAILNGKNFYYPITIPDVKPNHSYLISELTMTRVGYIEPDRTVDIETAKFSIQVEDWTIGMDDIDVEI